MKIRLSWSLGQDHPPSVAPASHRPNIWDIIKVSVTANDLLGNALPPLCTIMCPLLGSFCQRIRLNALPISSLGLRIDDNTIRVSVGLRLGTTLCRPYTCHHCGAEVNHLGTHGLRNCAQGPHCSTHSISFGAIRNFWIGRETP